MTPLLEGLDERIVGRYPREVTTRDGTTLTVTPMVPSDWASLERFLQATPESERQFFRRDVPDAARVERWCSELDYRHVLPLVAWDGKTIVADATLMQEPDLWTSHVGKLRLLVHPDYRQRGVGSVVLRDACEMARELGLHKIVHECAAAQSELIAWLRHEGFQEAACLPEFVRARDGTLHDMVMMVR